MLLPTHISHYFEREYGPFLNACDLSHEEVMKMAERERGADTGFNRFAQGEDFWQFRRLADDLVIEEYNKKFGRLPLHRPYYSVLGDADVVAGLYRDPYKIRIDLDRLAEHDVTFMVPDHFHLVGYHNIKVKTYYGFSMNEHWTRERYPFFGKLLTYKELKERLVELRIDWYLDHQREHNQWYRYVEAQIWADRDSLLVPEDQWIEAHPEPFTHGNMTILQNYKHRTPTRTE